MIFLLLWQTYLRCYLLYQIRLGGFPRLISVHFLRSKATKPTIASRQAKLSSNPRGRTGGSKHQIRWWSCRISKSEASYIKISFFGLSHNNCYKPCKFCNREQSGEHAFIGYRVFDREVSKPINLLNDLGAEFPPQKYQDLQTISEQAVKAGKNVVTVGPGEYQGSGFTQATMPASKVFGCKNFAGTL
jgi:hypothetical protein